jgi:hypothetical protein
MIKTRSYIANDKYKRWKRRYARNCAALRKKNRYINRHKFSPLRRPCDEKDTGGDRAQNCCGHNKKSRDAFSPCIARVSSWGQGDANVVHVECVVRTKEDRRCPRPPRPPLRRSHPAE